MKRTLSIALILLCLLSFAGCSQKESGQSGTPETTKAPETTTETVPAKPTEEPAETAFSRGSWDEEGKIFVNESTGIRIELSGDYTATADNELAPIYLGRDEDVSTWTEAEFKTEISIPDCQFVNSKACNTGVMYENLAAENAVGISEDQYIDIVVSQISGSYEGFEESEIYDLVLSGETYRAVDMKYSTNGVPVGQTMAVRSVGDYMTIIAFSSLQGDGEIETMISFFK